MLQEQDRQKLDGIVKQMVANKESDANIKLVIDDFKRKYSKTTPTVSADQPTDGYSPTFAYTGQESGLEAGLKAAGNLPGSAINLGKGLVSAISSPIETAKTIGSTVVGFGEKLGREVLERTPLASRVNQVSESDNERAFNQLTSMLKNRYGSLEALAKTATEDPFAFGTDVVTLASGGAGLLGKSAQFSGAVSKVGSTATKLATAPITKTAEFVSPLVSKTSRYVTSQATGLNPETITELVKNPAAFKGVTSESRVQTANAVKDALESRLSELSGLGKEYQVLRDSNQIVTVPENTIRTVLNKYGVKLDGNNQIVTTAESRPLSVGDRNAIQEFINNYGKERVLSSNAFLNTREALSNLAKYDASKTNLSTTISRELRSAYDTLGKKQIKGLEILDTQYAPERQLLGQVKKDILTPQGDLKDGAISRIANLTGKGKENLLARMKEIVPDIEQRVKVIKAVEDIERTTGQKTGTYVRAAIAGGGLYTGNVPVIIMSILTQPQIAVPLLKGAGYVGQRATPILNAVKEIANDVNNFRLPSALLDEEGKLQMGLSVKDISKINFPAEFEPDVQSIVKEMARRDIGQAKMFPDDVARQLREKAVDYQGRISNPGSFDFERFLNGEFKKVMKNENPVSQVSTLQKSTGTSDFPKELKPQLDNLVKKMQAENIGKSKAFPEDVLAEIKSEFSDWKTLKTEQFRDGTIKKLPKDSEFFDDKLKSIISKEQDIIPASSIKKDTSLTGKDAEIQDKSIAKYEKDPEGLTEEYLSENGKIVNTDEARKLFKDVGYNGINSAAVHEASSAVAKNAFVKLSKTKGKFENLAFAGGSGSGKTSAAKNMLQSEIKDSAAILDGNMSSMKSADYFINTSRKNGKFPTIGYVYREPTDAWVNGVIKRMLGNPDEGGRVVPLSVFLGNTEGSYNVIKQLLNDSNLGIKYDIKLIDNSLGEGMQKLLDRSKFAKLSMPSNLRDKLLALTKNLYAKGTINKEQYEALIK